jgi:hypothetical protein
MKFRAVFQRKNDLTESGASGFNWKVVASGILI